MVSFIERPEIWGKLRSASSNSTIVYLFLLAERLDGLSHSLREKRALEVGTQISALPKMEVYCRVGMYEFVGIARARAVDLIPVIELKNNVLCAVAAAGDNGLSTAEQLMSGASEAARVNPRNRMFVLTGGQVVPQ